MPVLSKVFDPESESLTHGTVKVFPVMPPDPYGRRPCRMIADKDVYPVKDGSLVFLHIDHTGIGGIQFPFFFLKTKGGQFAHKLLRMSVEVSPKEERKLGKSFFLLCGLCVAFL